MILLYHRVLLNDEHKDSQDVQPEMTMVVFSRQMNWLRGHFSIVALDEYLQIISRRSTRQRRPIAITFDDGFQDTFQNVAPFLIAEHLPATFFVSTGHLDDGELLWFSYLNALCFESSHTRVDAGGRSFMLDSLDRRHQTRSALGFMARKSGDPVDFSRALAKIYPIPAEVKRKYAGMTHAQLKHASTSEFLEIGGHTVTHPFLDQLPREEQQREIEAGKETLSALTGKPVRYFAYPGGEYNMDTIELVRKAGFEAAFAVTPKNLDDQPGFEYERMGIYSPSLIKLGLKAVGAASLMRRVGIHVG